MNSVNKENRLKKYFLEVFVIAMVAVFLELFLFGFRVWQDLGNEEILVPLNIGVYTDGAVTDGKGAVVFDQEKGDCRVQFDLSSLNHREIRNIAICAYSPDGEAYWDDFEGNTYAVLHSGMVEVRMVLSEGDQHTLLEPGAIGANAAKADVIAFPAGSRPELITMQFQSLMGQHVVLSDIRLNVQRQIQFSFGRFLLVFGFLLFLRCMYPKSRLWEMDMSGIGKRKRVYGELFFGVLFVGVVIGMILQNPVYIQGEGGFVPYRELTHALAKGQTWIDETPSAELLALSDPYDFLERMESGVKYKLDYALYHGKYYVYFGVVPCLLFFMPAYLVAGVDVPGWLVVSGLMVLLYAGIGCVINAMIERYSRKISVAGYLLLRICMVAVLSLTAVMSDPNAYYIPMLSAVVLYVFGLWFYLKASQKIVAERNSMGYLAAGSTFMAMVAGCRPQLVLAAAAVLPLLMKYLICKKEGRIRIRWKRCAAFAIPYGVVAIGLMYYNAIRFGSPFDFGASYNLTFANTYHWQFHMEAVGAGILYYLFRLPHVIAKAPFLEMTHLEWSNPGLLANHTSTGGLMMLYPVLWGGLLIFMKRQKEKNSFGLEIRLMGGIWLALTVFMAALTAVAGGLMDRYRQDYAIFAALAFSAGVIVFSRRAEQTADQKKDDIQAKKVKWGRSEWIRLFALIVTIGTVAVSLLMYFEDGVWWIAEANPEWYTKLTGTLAFWR